VYFLVTTGDGLISIMLYVAQFVIAHFVYCGSKSSMPFMGIHNDLQMRRLELEVPFS